MYILNNSQYQFQVLRDGKFVNAFTFNFPNGEQAKEVLDIYNEYRCAAALEARIEAVPDYAVGLRFKLPGWKHASTGDLDMIVSYAYHNGKEWKYHCGRVIGRKGGEVMDLYKNSQDIWHFIDDLIYVDYTTATGAEIQRERLK